MNPSLGGVHFGFPHQEKGASRNTNRHRHRHSETRTHAHTHTHSSEVQQPRRTGAFRGRSYCGAVCSGAKCDGGVLRA